jgi:hypothetical protein
VGTSRSGRKPLVGFPAFQSYSPVSVMCSQPSGATWESSSSKITTPDLLHHGMRPSVASNARCGRMAGSTCPHPEAHTDSPQGDPLRLPIARPPLNVQF